MTKDTGGNAERDNLILYFLRDIASRSGDVPLSTSMSVAEFLADAILAGKAKQ